MDEIDVNIGDQPSFNRKQVLQKYTTALLQFRSLAEHTNRVSPFYFDNFINWQYFQQRNASNTTNDDIRISNGPESGYLPQLAFLKMELLKNVLDRRRQIVYLIFYLTLAFLCIFAYHHDSKVVGYKMQSMAYLSTRMWRRMTIPVIKRFPRLTELYDETCLMENPFFQAGDLSCEACAHVEGVLDLTEEEQIETSLFKLSAMSKIKWNDDESVERPPNLEPFVFKTDQKPVQLEDFHRMYIKDHEIFQRDAFRVHSTKFDVKNLDDLFYEFNGTTAAVQSHTLWRCNRMQPARLLRQLFVGPTPVLPNTGVALERYIAIDTAKAPTYTLPTTECANVYVQQALGTRFIILRPTSECRHKCRTLSIRLPQSFALSYNWWYWKPISAPDPVAETMSISLIGSYC